MPMEFSKVTSKYQATVPADVRATLGIKAGDQLSWEITDGEVKVRRTSPVDSNRLKLATVVDSKVFAEWLSDEDEDAFRDL
jgi:antitoxin PrlF